VHLASWGHQESSVHLASSVSQAAQVEALQTEAFHMEEAFQEAFHMEEAFQVEVAQGQADQALVVPQA